MSMSGSSDVKSSAQEKWDAAINGGKIDVIKDLLKKGYIPNDLKQNVTVEEKSLSLVEILIHGNRLHHETRYFDIADKLLKLGAALPTPLKKMEHFEKKTDYLDHLVNNVSELYLAIRRTPDIIKVQDEMGMTLLHHAASIGMVMDSSNASLIHYLLFRATGVDFSIQDSSGDTPIHIAAYMNVNKVTFQYIFRNYVLEAVKHDFDFSTLNDLGQAIIHIVTRINYEHPHFGRRSNLNWLITHVPGINLNALSSSGSSALFYAINHMHLEDAKALLDKGADPIVYKNPQRNPLLMTNQLIKGFKESQSDFTQDIHKEKTETAIKTLQALKKRLLDMAAELKDDGSHVGHRKSCRFFPHNEITNAWLEKNRHKDSLLQEVYDSRFGLTPK